MVGTIQNLYSKITIPLKYTFSKLRVWLVFLLICMFFYACRHDSKKSQSSANNILEFIDKTREENTPIIEKLQIYDSLYTVVRKQEDDTLKRKYLMRLGKAYDESDKLEIDLKLQIESKDLSIRIQDSFGLGHAYHNIGRYYALTDKIDSAYFYYNKSNLIFNKIKDVRKIGHTYLGMSIMQKYAGDFIGAESNAIKAIGYLKNTQDTRYLASAHSTLGTISRELGDYENAIKEHERAFELREKIERNNPINTGTLNNIGTVYEYQGNFSKAIENYKLGLAYDSLLYKRPKTYIRLLDNLAYAQFLSGENVNYSKIYGESIRISDSIQDLLVKASSTMHLAEYYAKKKRLDSANYLAQQSLVISKNINFNKFVIESLLLLTEINEPKEALKYSKEYIRITDSLQKVERNYRDQFARIRFGTEELEEENLKVSQQRTWLLNAVVGMAILGVLGYIVYYQRKLKHQYKTSNLEQRLLRSQLNPHFLFNALNSVSGLVQKKSDQTIPYISKLGELLRSILENSREEFISLEEELDTITTYLELQSNFSKKFTFEIKIIGGLNQQELLIPPMFLQPFIENAIDHGFKGKNNEKITITVIQKLKDQVLYFSIEDNGIGYSNAMKHKKDKLGYQSLSGTILKERLVLYSRVFKKKARYVIEDLESNPGTKVHLYLPYQLDV